MNAQKHQKLNITSQSNTATLSAMNAPNYKFITPAHVGDMSKKSVYMVAPAVLAVTNNS